MSSATTELLPGPSEEPVFRLSVQQYHAMVDAGVLSDDDPVELLEGILVFKMPKKPNHRLTVRLLTSAIDALLPVGWHFQAQEPITLSDGEPEPDGAIVRGQACCNAKTPTRGASTSDSSRWSQLRKRPCTRYA